MKRLKIFLNCSMFLFALFSLMLVNGSGNTTLPVYGRLGGQLHLNTTQPGKIAASEIKMISFGFARCTEVCPLVLATYAQVLNQTTSMDGKLAAVFVSIDPEHDDLGALGSYLQKFHKSIVGMVGDRKQIDLALSQFAAFAQKDQSSGLIEHTDRIYLLDADNRVRAMFKPNEPASEIARIIGLLI